MNDRDRWPRETAKRPGNGVGSSAFVAETTGNPRGEEGKLSEGSISRKKFLRLGTAVGLGSAALPLVSACGGGAEGSGAATSPPSGAAPTGSEVGAGQVVAKESEVTPNSAVPFTDTNTGEPAVLVRLESGEFVAYSAICTHQRCTVPYRPDTQRLACPCHGGIYNPAKNAAVEAGPPPRPLPPIKIEVKDGEVRKV